MLNFSTSVVLPLTFSSVCRQLRWIVDFSSYLVLLCLHFDIKLCELWCIKEIVDHLNDAFEPLFRVRDLVVLQFLHLATV
jgi:hypothetical protein